MAPTLDPPDPPLPALLVSRAAEAVVVRLWDAEPDEDDDDEEVASDTRDELNVLVAVGSSVCVPGIASHPSTEKIFPGAVDVEKRYV